MIGGPNGAGKTTLVTRRVGRRIPIVNPDDIAETIPRVAGARDERRAGALALERRAVLLEQRADFGIETTLTGASPLRLIGEAKAAGYKVTLVFVGLSGDDLSLRRVADRVRRGGHPVPVSAIERRYPATLINCAKAIGLVDRAFLLDNSGERRRLLAALEDGRLRFAAREFPDWAARVLAAHTVD